ncbi:acyltransferase [Muricauda brasiliensis]|uniref:acyltransferase n=1 Tax=Muricauda brasiliensis TaxID=2162892 RepID=UPI000D333BA1|nr:acyltransferase [Muricauda brasiliensis]
MKQIKRIVYKILALIPFTKFFYETRQTQTPITIRIWFTQKILGFNRSVYWPVHFTSIVGFYRNIYAGIDTSPGYSPGCYIQGGGKVYIGDYTQIAPNVGIISANHDLYDSREHVIGEVRIGKYCWIGMNAVILPNVSLGDFTIVAAGAIVTKSFPEGYCVIGGNPAKIIKSLDKEKCVPFHNEYEYNGYIKNGNFEKFRHRNLNI